MVPTGLNNGIIAALIGLLLPSPPSLPPPPPTLQGPGFSRCGGQAPAERKGGTQPVFFPSAGAVVFVKCGENSCTGNGSWDCWALKVNGQCKPGTYVSGYLNSLGDEIACACQKAAAQ